MLRLLFFIGFNMFCRIFHEIWDNFIWNESVWNLSLTPLKHSVCSVCVSWIWAQVQRYTHVERHSYATALWSCTEAPLSMLQIDSRVPCCYSQALLWPSWRHTPGETLFGGRAEVYPRLALCFSLWDIVNMVAFILSILDCLDADLGSIKVLSFTF